jgi:HEAT repeat protein
MKSPGKEPIAQTRTVTPSEKADLVRVREILKSFAHAVSGLKLYPSGHENVRRYRDDLYARLDDFLGRDHPLELGVGEDVFTFLGQTVYQDDNVQKSLPYFFFKDGMQKLSFLPGLTPADLQDFLVLIRDAFLRGPGSADIVDLMWQKEIEHLRFFAPNEFLTSKVASGTTMPLDFSVDPRTLGEGTIELRPEDRPDPPAAVRESGVPYADPVTEPVPMEDGNEMAALLESERGIPIERDFLDTLYELLRLEDRPGPFAETLVYLTQYHEKLIQTARFSSVLLLWDEMAELARDLQEAQPEKASAIAALEERFLQQSTPEVLRAVALQGIIWDFSALFAFLERIGPSALPFAGDLYETSVDPDLRARAEAFFARMGRRDPARLAALANPRRPALARAVISALAGQEDRRVLPFLTAIAGHPDASVRRAVLQFARSFPGPEARRTLAAFLGDPDRALCLQAVLALQADADPDAVPALLRIASPTSFRDRDAQEIAAILAALGATKAPEAFDFLQELVARKRLRLAGKNLGLVQAAVHGLEQMGTPAAWAALEACSRRRGRRLRAACRAALARRAGGADVGKGAA